jgi:hypothetical protein
MSDEPCSLEHSEEYVVRVGWHPDATACVVVEYPGHRTPEEAQEVLSMIGELADVADMVAVTPAGRLVARRG